MPEKTREECLAWWPKANWTLREKVDAFDSLQKMALEWLNRVRVDENCDALSDVDHSMAEAVLRFTLGKEVFDYTNPLMR